MATDYKFRIKAIDHTKKAFDSVSGGLNKIGKGAANVTKGIVGLGVAVGATAGALAILVKRNFEFIDAIGKTSTRTGIATSTIQAFHLAARESGTNIEGENNALQKFARSVGDAQRGLKTQKDIFKALNVELVDSNGNYRTMDFVLADTAKGIANLGSQSEKATSLANLFGKQGILLTGAIEDLAEKGLDGFIDRAEQLGLILSSKTIRKVEAFNDAIGVIGMQLTAVKSNITTAFLPVFDALQQKISEKMQSIKNSAGGFDQLGVDIAGSVIEGFATIIEGIGILQFKLAEFFTSFDERMEIAGLRYQQMVVMLTMPVGRVFFIDQFEKQIKALEKQIQDGVSANKDFKNSMLKVADGLRSMKPNIDNIRDANRKLKESTGEAANSMFDAMNPLTAYKNSIEDTGKALDNVAVNSMKRFEDSIIDGLKNGKLAFKDFATYVVEQLIRIAIQQIVIAKLIDPFRAFIDDAFNIKGVIQGNTKQLALDNPYFLTSAGTGFTRGGETTVTGKKIKGGRALGGFVGAGNPYMVGESGRELFIPSQNGQIISNQDLRRTQQTAPVVNFNISTVDAAGFDQLLTSRKGLITQIINNAMNTQGKMGIV